MPRGNDRKADAGSTQVQGVDARRLGSSRVCKNSLLLE